jgi:hypothetical protein
MGSPMDEAIVYGKAVVGSQTLRIIREFQQLSQNQLAQLRRIP